MTKFNKAGKSTFVIAILALVLVALLAFGGTYAYFSAKSADLKGTLQMGHLSITSVKGDASGDVLIVAETIGQPGEKLFKDAGRKVTATVNSNIKYYTRVTFTVNLTAKDKGAEHTENCCDNEATEIASLLLFTLDKGGLSGSASTDWQTDSGVATPAQWNGTTGIATSKTTYYKLAPNAGGASSTEEFTFNIQVNSKMGAVNGVNDARGCSFWQEATVEIIVNVEVLQADFTVTDTQKVDLTTGKFVSGETASQVWEKALKGELTEAPEA